MPIDNAANRCWPEGIMMAMTNRSSITISDDHQTVTIGAGVTWPPLYAYLDDYNVTANGILGQWRSWCNSGRWAIWFHGLQIWHGQRC